MRNCSSVTSPTTLPVSESVRRIIPGAYGGRGDGAIRSSPRHSRPSGSYPDWRLRGSSGVLAVEGGVGATGLEEGLVGALLDDAAALEDEDAVGVADRGEAVRDHEGGALGGERVERAQDQRLGARVHGARGLVEDQDRR